MPSQPWWLYQGEFPFQKCLKDVLSWPVNIIFENFVVTEKAWKVTVQTEAHKNQQTRELISA